MGKGVDCSRRLGAGGGCVRSGRIGAMNLGPTGTCRHYRHLPVAPIELRPFLACVVTCCRPRACYVPGRVDMSPVPCCALHAPICPLSVFHVPPACLHLLQVEKHRGAGEEHAEQVWEQAGDGASIWEWRRAQESRGKQWRAGVVGGRGELTGASAPAGKVWGVLAGREAAALAGMPVRVL